MSEILVTNDEIVLFTGLTVSDAKLTLFNAAMTELLASSLGISQFGSHDIALELVRVYNKEYIRLRGFPIDFSTIELIPTYSVVDLLTGYTFREDPYDFRKVWMLDSNGNPTYLNQEEVYVNYTAGYILRDDIVIFTNPDVDDTIVTTEAGVETTWTFKNAPASGANEIEIGLDVTATAENIATELGGDLDEFRITLPAGMSVRLGTAEAVDLVITNSDVPNDLKMAIAYLVAGAMTDKTQIEGILSYKIGTKQVNLRDTTEKSFVESVLEKYLTRYKRINVIS